MTTSLGEPPRPRASPRCRLRRYARTEQRIGDDVSKLKAPANAETANAQLARGQHDEAAQIQVLVRVLVEYKTVRDAFASLQKKLGYTTSS